MNEAVLIVCVLLLLAAVGCLWLVYVLLLRPLTKDRSFGVTKELPDPPEKKARVKGEGPFKVEKWKCGRWVPHGEPGGKTYTFPSRKEAQEVADQIDRFSDRDTNWYSKYGTPIYVSNSGKISKKPSEMLTSPHIRRQLRAAGRAFDKMQENQ